MSEGANVNENSEGADLNKSLEGVNLNETGGEGRVKLNESPEFARVLNNTMGGLSNFTNSAGILTPIKGPVLYSYTREQVRVFLEENKRYIAIVNARNGFEIVPIRYRIDVEIASVLQNLLLVDINDDVAVVDHLKEYVALKETTLFIDPDQLIGNIRMELVGDSATRTFQFFQKVNTVLRNAEYKSEKAKRKLNFAIAKRIVPQAVQTAIFC